MAQVPDVQVMCITLGRGGRGHEAITHLGGATWRWPVSDVIESLRKGTNTFFTQVDGQRAEVRVVEGEGGPYLRTHADGRWNDNLLALGACD
jgi:hypothetical protein